MEMKMKWSTKLLILSSLLNVLSPIVCDSSNDDDSNNDDDSSNYESENYDSAEAEVLSDEDLTAEGGAKESYKTSYGQRDYDDRPKKKVFVPVYVPEKEKKKMKILSVDKGFFIPGGQQLFGKFKSLKHCMKACAASSSCFSGDYNPWLHKCYQHTNTTACNRQSSHPQYVHFSKVPCSISDAPAGNVFLGVSALNGIEIKGIDSLSQCIKKCASAGSGIPASIVGVAVDTQASSVIFNQQTCFGIDYDFSNHKCYFFTQNYAFSPGAAAPFALPFGLLPIFCHHLTTATYPAPRNSRPNPSVVHISMCPQIVAG